MSDNSVILPFFVVTPLAGAFINALLGRRIPGLSDFLGSLLTLILLVLSLTAVRIMTTESTAVYLVGGWQSPIGIVMVLDGLTTFMLVTVNTVTFAITMYARNYMNRYTAKEL